MVPPPMWVSENASAGRLALSPEKPPALINTAGSRMKKMPTVLMMNWTKSVSVIDHMPPSTE
jgi:hypothetical protein